ncbi:hypothetical protein Efla_003814 [Eimeria flavescens]
MLRPYRLLLLLLFLLHVAAPSKVSTVYVHCLPPCQSLTEAAATAAATAAPAAAAARPPSAGFALSCRPSQLRLSRSSRGSSRSSSTSSSSSGALRLQMASSRPRTRAPATRPLQRMRQQAYELRVALQQKNRCLYTPMPPAPQQQHLQQRFPKSLQQMRVPLHKQKKQQRWLVEKQTKLAWRKVQQHVQQLPQQLQQQQTLLLQPQEQQLVNAAAAAHNESIRDAVWRSFIATRVVPRLALLARQQEKPQQEEFEALQEQQQLLLNERRRAQQLQQQQQQQEGSLLQQVSGMRRRLKAALRRDSGYALSAQQQLHALLGLRVPVHAAEGTAATAAAAALAAKARELAQQTRQPFLQFLVDLHFVVEQLEVLQQQLPQHYCDFLQQQQQQPQGEEATGCLQQQQQQQQAALRDYLAMAPPTRADRLLEDVRAFADLLELDPPAVSQEAHGLVASLRGLHQENFTRFLARAYKFSKGWQLTGRFFLLAVARRQQLLPRRPAAAAWDADTDNLEATGEAQQPAAAAAAAAANVAIDSLALLWRRRPSLSCSEHQSEQQQQQEVFLQELDGADTHFRQALLDPLLRALRDKAVSILGVKNNRRTTG